MCLLEQRQKSIEEWVGRARGLLYSHGDSNKCESRRVVCHGSEEEEEAFGTGNRPLEKSTRESRIIIVCKI